MRILVLGDSSSAGIGDGDAVYPFRLYERLAERGAVAIENHAVPGFTSADAARWFERQAAKGRWDVVLVYLGNNEATRSKYKGAYRRVRDRRRLLPSRPRSPAVREQRERERFVIDDAPADASAPATTPEDFAKNLRTIARTSMRMGARCIVLNPIANSAFPPALMAANAPVFRIVGLPWELAHRLVPRSAEAHALVAALALHERGDLPAAADGYSHLMTTGGALGAAARNNLAVLRAAQGDLDAAAGLLSPLVEAGGAASAVAVYNEARLLRVRGDVRRAEEAESRAVELDPDLYRIKSAYRAAISTLADVEVLDLADILGVDDFVDYCHPDAAGHMKIAAALAERITPGASGASSYARAFPSPDAFFEPHASLLEYYALDLGVDSQVIGREAAALAARARGGDVPAAESAVQARIARTWRHALEHPAITGVDDLVRWAPEYGYEIGNAPEYYVERIVSAYGLDAERRRARILSRVPVEPRLDPRLDAEYAERVLAKAEAQLRASELFDDRRGERIATIQYWYTREAFRYGTQSRASMLYPLWTLERISEGAQVAAVAARASRRQDLSRAAEELLLMLGGLREVHERFSLACVHARYETADTREYVRELSHVRSAAGSILRDSKR